MCYRLNCAYPKFMFKSKHSVPKTMTLFGNRVVAYVNYLRWGHTEVEWTPNQCDRCPHKKGKFRHRYTHREHHVKTEVLQPQTNELLEARRESWNGCIPGAFRGSMALSTPWFATGFQNCETINFCCFRSHLVGHTTVMATLRNWYRVKWGEDGGNGSCDRLYHSKGDHKHLLSTCSS